MEGVYRKEGRAKKVKSKKQESIVPGSHYPLGKTTEGIMQITSSSFGEWRRFCDRLIGAINKWDG